MPRPDDAYVADLLDCCRALLSYLKRGGDTWWQDQMLQDAVVLRLERMGEIARAVSPDLRDRHADIPWAQMRGFRNLAVHRYYEVDVDRVRLIAETQVAPLQQHLLELAQAEFPDLDDGGR